MFETAHGERPKFKKIKRKRNKRHVT